MAGEDEEIVEDVEFEADLDGDVEELEPEDLDEEDLEEDLVEEDEFVAIGADEDDLVEEDEEDEEEEAPRRTTATPDEEDEDEDLVAPDDVEADLDTILKDRLVSAEEAADDDDEEVEVEAGDAGDRLQPRRPGEFVCQSCFLLKPQGQLADEANMLCLDCV